MTAVSNPSESTDEGDARQFVTLYLGNQLFGIPVLQVHDILAQQRITPVPLAQPAILGSLNLRGRIVTAIDMRTAIGLEKLPADAIRMNVVVEHANDLYSLVVDRVGEVLTVPEKSYERNPGTLDVRFRQVSAGIYRLDSGLLVVLDVARLLKFDLSDAA